MRRLAGLAFATVLLACALTSGSAQADVPAMARCAQVWVKGTGLFNDDKCQNNAALFEFMKVFAGNGKLIGESECAQAWVKKTGRFNDPACHESLANGEFIEVHPAKLKVKGKGGANVLTAGTNVVTCQASTTSTGEITTIDSIGKLIVKFTGCKTSTGGSPCTAKSVGAAEGEIITKTLKGQLGTVKSTEATSKRGFLISPETGTKFTMLAANACTPETSVNGSVAAEAAPVNALQSTGKLVFGVTAGAQNIKSLSILSVTKSPEIEAFGLAATNEGTVQLEFEEPIEVA